MNRFHLTTTTTTLAKLTSVGIVALAGALCACTGDGGDGGGSGGGGTVCSTGASASVCIAKSTFGIGEPIRVQFQGGPALPADWIAVYPADCCTPDCPSGSTLWKYCATDTQEALATGVTAGSVTIDGNANGSQWPLSAGTWELLYLVDDGYEPIARLTFRVEGSGGASDSSCGHSSGGGGDECSFDSECSGSCSGSCYGCRSGSCTCGYEGVSGSCIF